MAMYVEMMVGWYYMYQGAWIAGFVQELCSEAIPVYEMDNRSVY